LRGNLRAYVGAACAGGGDDFANIADTLPIVTPEAVFGTRRRVRHTPKAAIGARAFVSNER
jgi:hypothetical protein